MATPRWTPPRTPFLVTNVGVCRKTVTNAVKRGEIVQLIPRVYIAREGLPDESALSPHEYVRAQHTLLALAYQVRDPRLVASHETAALALGLPVFTTGTLATYVPRFTVDPSTGMRSRKEPRVLVGTLPPQAVTTVATDHQAELRVTTDARTALDLATEFAMPYALMTVDAVVRQVAGNFRGVRNLRGDLPQRVLQVARQPLLQAICTRAHARRDTARIIELADPRRESAGESLSFGRIVAAGLPVPLCQVAIATEHGVVYPDFYWPELRLAAECDGLVKYDGTFGVDDGVLARQARRERDLKDGGIAVARLWVSDMDHNHQRVIDELARFMVAQGWDGVLRKRW